MKASVDMEDWKWGRLATIAEFRKTTIGELVAEGIEIILDRDRDRLRELGQDLRSARDGGYRAPRSGSLSSRLGVTE